MTRTVEWTVFRGNDRREFTAHYVDDSPERAEAIAFFENHDCGLYSECPVDDYLWALPLRAANEFLAANPAEQTFESLYVRSRRDDVSDDDLARLVQLPELRSLHILSNQITDVGVRHISSLYHLERLLLSSPLVTDACLESIAQLQSLRYVDLQGSCGITKCAFDSLKSRLPHLAKSWEPYHGAM